MCGLYQKEFNEKARNIKIIPPTLTFENQLELDLGEVTCVLKHVGGDAHDSVVMYIKEEKILFVGDCLYADIFLLSGTIRRKERLN